MLRASANANNVQAGAIGAVTLISHSAAGFASANSVAEQILATVPIPQNILGANGMLVVQAKWTVNNSATSKIGRVRFGASGAGVGGTGAFSIEHANQLIGGMFFTIENRAATNSQIVGGSATNFVGFGVSANAWSTSAIDTTAASEVVFTATKATGTDTLTLESFAVWCVR